MNLKTNLPIIIALLLPLAMIIAVAFSIYLPNRNYHPKYDFLFSTISYKEVSTSDAGLYSYTVENNKLTKKPQYIEQLNGFPDKTSFIRDPELFIYHVKDDTIESISYEAIQSYHLDPSTTSPDGYKITYGTRSEGVFPFMFSNTDYNARYLKGDGTAHKLKLSSDQGIYRIDYYSFTFLGWITQP